MIKGLIRTTLCPKCGGRVFLDQDHYGFYKQCLQCGHLQNLENVAAVSARASGSVIHQPARMQRTKIKL